MCFCSFPVFGAPCWLLAGTDLPFYLWLVVLQSVGLVYHQAGPCDGAQNGLIYSDQLIGRQQHVELDGSVFLQGGRGSVSKNTKCWPVSMRNHVMVLKVLDMYLKLHEAMKRSLFSVTTNCQAGCHPPKGSPSFKYRREQLTYLHAKHLASWFYCAVFKGELVLPDDRPAVFVPGVRQHIEIWCPHLKLPLPVYDSGEGSTHQERPLGVTLRKRRFYHLLSSLSCSFYSMSRWKKVFRYFQVPYLSKSTKTAI